MDNPQSQTNVSDEEAFAEEVGTLVFQSALMQFLAAAEEVKAKEFETYVETHAASEDFIERLCEAYPEFEQLLKDEMLTLEEEIKEIIPE